MKHLYYAIVFIFGNLSFSQSTYIPDDNFEQALIDYGYDDVLDDYVDNANIFNITFLQLEDYDIYDLTGIAGFVGLESLDLSRNFLTSIDVSQNLNLEHLDCAQITTLVELNIQNGNTENFLLGASDCPNLVCVQVDDVDYVNANINTQFFFFGSFNYTISLDCSTLSIEDYENHKTNIIAYPNPSSQYAQLKGLTKTEHYKIYNIQGEIVNEGSVSIDEKIDLSGLIKGVYFITLDNVQAVKIIKE